MGTVYEIFPNDKINIKCLEKLADDVGFCQPKEIDWSCAMQRAIHKTIVEDMLNARHNEKASRRIYTRGKIDIVEFKKLRKK